MAVRPINAINLKKYIKGLDVSLPYDKQDKDDVIRQVCCVIDNWPTLTPQNEWVSVKDRLPGVSGNYICAVKDKNGSVWTIPAEWSLEMKMWIGAFGEIKNIVTHWMPLPEPPDRRPPEGEAWKILPAVGKWIAKMHFNIGR